MSFLHPRKSKLDFIVLFATLCFAIVEFFGDGFTFYIQNTRCFPLLGCNAGFFGYDALIHFFGGIFFATLLVWLMHHYPRISLLHKTFWKSALIILALVALIALVWELYEFTLDHFNLFTIHTDGIFTDTLAQPGLADTIGDCTMELLGTLGGIGIIWVWARHTMTMIAPQDTNA